MMSLDDHLARGAAPIVAILRGVRPDEVVAIGRGLVDAGITLIEVPLNSPEPLASIERLATEFGDQALVGGGTVLDAASVDAVTKAGGRLIVSPNTDPEVIARTTVLGLDGLPGFATPTEAFAALRAGARRLKLFPGSTLGPGHLRAIREVLPSGTGLWAVGGAGAETLSEWLKAGAEGIGVGGSLYRPGDEAPVIAERAAALCESWRAARPSTHAVGRQTM